MGNFYNSFLLYTKYNTVLQTGKLLVPGTAAIYSKAPQLVCEIEDHHTAGPSPQLFFMDQTKTEDSPPMQRRNLIQQQPQQPPAQIEMERVNTRAYYSEYHGHKVHHLRSILNGMRSTNDGKNPIIFTAGDSSLDNKYWFDDRAAAVGAYRNILSPPTMKRDVTYWLNQLAMERNLPYQTINTAVEATTLNGRACCSLLAQDKFIKQNIREQDILVVSVGGNDIALMPAPCTICNMIVLQCCTPFSCIEKTKPCCGGPLPCDDCCCGCGCGCLSTATAFPACCMGYFYHMFQTRIQTYVKNMTSGNERPKIILISMIYNPDEAETGSWADGTLGLLGYNSNPKKLQLLIRNVFENAVSNIHIEGSTVIPLPLFQVLDGKNTKDYCERVEPSPQGGKKMADQILNLLPELQ